MEPFDQGMLDVGDGNQIHWYVLGNPDGKPAVHLDETERDHLCQGLRAVCRADGRPGDRSEGRPGAD
ncbi:hypothetical protein ABZX92_39840, partial [Lentzea sp. NPDC006480]